MEGHDEFHYLRPPTCQLLVHYLYRTFTKRICVNSTYILYKIKNIPFSITFHYRPKYFLIIPRV